MSDTVEQSEVSPSPGEPSGDSPPTAAPEAATVPAAPAQDAPVAAMSSLIRIKRKVGDDPQQSLLAAKRRRLDVSDDVTPAGCDVTPAGESSAAARTDTVLQFVGTMTSLDTALPPTAICAMRCHPRPGADGGDRGGDVRRGPGSVPAALRSAKEARRQLHLQQQKVRRYKVVSRRRGQLEAGSDHYGMIDVEEELEEEEMVAAEDAAPPELTCNGQVLERVPAGGDYVYDVYVTSAPLPEDEDVLELRPHHDAMLWELRAARDSDSDPFADDQDDSNAEDNWRNDYPEELEDSDYDRYLADPELDLVRRFAEHGVANEDEAPLAYGIDDDELDLDGYERYKKRAERDLEERDSDEDGYAADYGGASDDED